MFEQIIQPLCLNLKCFDTGAKKFQSGTDKCLILTTPRTVDMCTGETLTEGELRRTPGCEAAHDFKSKTRGCCHDRAPQNDRSERDIMRRPQKK